VEHVVGRINKAHFPTVQTSSPINLVLSMLNLSNESLYIIQPKECNLTHGVA